MKNNKFDLKYKQILKKLEDKDQKYNNTSDHQDEPDERSYDPINVGSELQISPELDPRIKKSIIDSGDTTYDDESDYDAILRRRRNRKFRDGFKLMRGDDIES